MFSISMTIRCRCFVTVFFDSMPISMFQKPNFRFDSIRFRLIESNRIEYFDNRLITISAVPKSCFYHIRDLRRIRNAIQHTTLCTIDTSLILSKLDYCNSLPMNLPSTQTKRLQLVLNAAARAVTKTPKFNHISPILKSLHWLKINERIQYKVLSLTYKTLHSCHPSYLHSLLSLKRNSSTRSSSLVTFNRLCNNSCLKITNRSFHHTAPAL